MLKGSIVALITPFDGENLSEDTYLKLINYHLESGTNGVVPGGTTGESPTLSHNEHKKIIELAVKECKGKIPVIAGTGSNSTDEAIELSKFAEKNVNKLHEIEINPLIVCKKNKGVFAVDALIHYFEEL